MGEPLAIVTEPSELPTGYCQMFALTWFLYDYALTFDDEYRYIWCRRITWNAILFLATRYFTGVLLVMSAITCTVRGFSQVAYRVHHHSQDTDHANRCDIFDWFESIGTFVLFFFVQCILQARIYAMYDRSRKILYSNIGLFILEAIVAGIVTAFYFGDAVRVIVPSWVLGSCFTERRTEFAAVWAAPLAFESYLAFLAVRKMLQVHESLKALDGMSLMALMVRDNIVYFLMIVLAMILNLAIFAFKPGLNPGVSVITIVHAAGAIGGTRIVLSLLHNAESTVRLSSTGTSDERATSGFAFGRAPGEAGTLASLSPDADEIASLPHRDLAADAEAALPGDARQWGSLSSAAGAFAPWAPVEGARQWGWSPGAGLPSDVERDSRKESLPMTVWSESSTRRGSAVPLLAGSAEGSRRGSVWSDATRRGSVAPAEKIDERDEEQH